MNGWGLARSQIDTGLFTYRRGESIIWVIVWVDDSFIADNDPELRAEFVEWGKRLWAVDSRSKTSRDLQWILHIGVHRDWAKRRLELSQELYVRNLVGKYMLTCARD